MYPIEQEREQLLNMLRLNDSPTEIQGIADFLEVSLPTAYKIVNVLTKEHCLTKNKTRISVDPSHYTLIGISIGTTICKISFVDFTFNRYQFDRFSVHKANLINRIEQIINLGNDLYNKTEETDKLLEECKSSNTHNYIFFKTPKGIKVLKDILDTLMQYIMEQSDKEELHVLSIGISCTGTINRKTQTIEESHSLKWLNRCGINTLFFPDKLSFCQKNNIHISLVQNAVASVIAEKVDLYKRANDIRFLSHKKDHNIAALYLEYGVGVGMYLNQLYYGTCGYTGEIGHLPAPKIEEEPKYKTIRPDPTFEKCTCGNIDCYEFKIRKYCFGDFYIKKKDKKGNITEQPKDFKDASASDIKNFLKDNPIKAKLLGEYLGSIINILTGIMDVGSIILTGKIYKSEEEIQNAIAEGQDRSRLIYSRNNCPVLFSRLGSSAPSIGAALYSYKEKYNLDYKWDIE